MARKTLKRIIRAAVEDSLPDQTKLDAIAAAVARHPKAATLIWHRMRNGCHELHTPYGTLQVHAHFRGCWIVTRDTAPLVHAHNGKQAIIIGLPVAKAVALLHAAAGFGSRPLIDDNLAWGLDLQ